MAKISNLDFYAILGVHPNAEDIVIRAAFKALAQRYHPDRFTGAKDEAHRRMADLTNAYETLADPARRRKYDRRRGLASRQARFYFKNPARERQQPFGALAARAAARKAQRYRMAVYVLMVVVVILSGFNLHQHSAQIKDLFAWNRSSSGTIAVSVPALDAGGDHGSDPAGRTRGCADNHGERQGPAHRARKHASDHLQCDGLAGARTERLRCTGCSTAARSGRGDEGTRRTRDRRAAQGNRCCANYAVRSGGIAQGRQAAASEAGRRESRRARSPGCAAEACRRQIRRAGSTARRRSAAAAHSTRSRSMHRRGRRARTMQPYWNRAGAMT